MSSELPRRTMRLHHTFFTLSLTAVTVICSAALPACTAGQDKSLDAAPVQEPAPAEVADPMASFARLVGGEWQVTFTSGMSASHAWLWGPGKFSMGKMAYMSDSADNPWAGEVMYWHPGRKQVRMLSLHGEIPGIGRGVADGTIKFEGQTADAVIDLYQPPGRRKLKSRMAFDGLDKYRESLLEDSGGGYQPLAEWEFVRIKERSGARPHTAELAPPKLSKHLKAFEALVGPTWESGGEAKGDWAARNALHIRSTFEWVESLEVIYARVVEPASDGQPTSILEAYIYHHVTADALRCLALSNRGGVYEGDVSVLDGGALQLDLKGYEGDRVVLYAVRLDFEKDGTLHHRVWSLQGTERTLLLDVHHKKLEPKKD